MGKALSSFPQRRNWISGGMDDKNKLTLDPSNTLQNQVLGTIYGNCIGDAIGLMTEFLSKDQARKYYGGKHLEYPMKEIAAAKFFHQMVFPEADWTDDSDQMILILQSLMDNNGKANAVDFSKKLLEWVKHGFAELGDPCGMGLGQTTSKVVHHENFTTDPHEAALSVWEKSNRTVAPNGGVMRTSIVGVHQYDDVSQVIGNTKVFCKVTHADPRCVASCVAVTTAISMMLQGLHKTSKGHYDVARITEASFNYAKECLLRDDKGNLDEEQVRELQFHMNASLSELELDNRKKIGYTFKCLGAGFWALRQSSFRDAIEAITLEGGDADTNGAVAGALLGCKLGYCKLPSSWKNELKHKEWLDDILARYFQSGIMTESCGTPVDGPEVGIGLTGGEQDDAEQATAPKTGGDSSSATDTTKDMTTELSAEVKVQSADLSPDQQASISKSEVTAEGQQDPEDPHRSKDQPEEASEVTAETEVRGQCNSPASDPTEATQIGESSGDLSETKPEDLACQ